MYEERERESVCWKGGFVCVRGLLDRSNNNLFSPLSSVEFGLCSWHQQDQKNFREFRNIRHQFRDLLNRILKGRSK